MSEYREMEHDDNSILYKGIFWIVDTENLENNDPYLFRIVTDRNGTVIIADADLTSRKGDNYNHKITWQTLPKALTHNKPFNYYPRGRVEIWNDTARIFINSSLYDDGIIEYIEKEYNLNNRTISNIKVIIDNSKHYHNSQ